MIVLRLAVVVSLILAISPIALNQSLKPARTSLPQKTAGRASKPVLVAKFQPGLRIELLPDGTLIGAFARTVDGAREIAARYSSDNGHNWSEPQTLLKLSKEAGSWGGPDILVDQNGEVHFFLLNADQGNPGRGIDQRRIDIWHTRSTGGRKAWQAPKRIWEGYTGSLNSVIELRNGRIILPFSYLTNRSWSDRGEGFYAFTYTGKFNSTVVYSDDSGDTWHQSPAALRVPTPDITTILGAIEPVVLQLKDGDVWMLIRSQMGRFYESFSNDGRDWSRPQPSNITSSDSPAGLVRLKDGRILLIWNNSLRFPYAYGGRHVLHAAVSEDEGRTWRGYREVARDERRGEPPPPSGDHGTAYPMPALTKDGRVIYSSGQGEGGRFSALLDPDWLYETVQRDDFSAGLEAWSVFGTKGPELVPHPRKLGARALSLRKPAADWPAAAVWNFPAGVRGQLRLRLLLRPGFESANIGLTDHFSVPFDEEDLFYNLFNLEIGKGGQLTKVVKLSSNRWYNIELSWDSARRECRVLVDGRQVAVLPQLRTGNGANYLRLRSTAAEMDQAGLLIESVEADVSQSW